MFLQRQLEEEKSEDVKVKLPPHEDPKFSTAKFEKNDFIAGDGSDPENSPLTATIEKDIRKRPADLIIFESTREDQIQSPISPYLPYEIADAVGGVYVSPPISNSKTFSGAETAVFVRRQGSSSNQPNDTYSNASPMVNNNPKVHEAFQEELNATSMKAVDLGDTMEVDMESMR